MRARLTAAALLLAALAAAPAAAARLPCPLTPTWGWLASPYGWRLHPATLRIHHHWGIDIAAPEGTPVLASMSGVVRYAGSYGSYGLTVYIEHADAKGSGG